MMKAHNKNRKHPTCSRCRFHGKKDIRVLQHQCPFRNCTCSSCFLIKRRSIIYRAQKNLDKHEDNSNEAESPGNSGDGSAITANFSEMSNKSTTISRSSDSSSDTTNFGTTCVPSDVTPMSASQQSWESLEQISNISCLASTSGSAKSSEHYKISDFQSLCLTFPELSPSQLQTIFEQCGNDFQRTIDRILMTKWCNNESDSKPNQMFQNNNDWSMSSSMPADYAPNPSPFSPNTTPLQTNPYHANNTDHCFEWRSNMSNQEYGYQDLGSDYFYDQSVMSQQGPNWNYDNSPYWFTYNSSHSQSQGSPACDEVSTGLPGWHSGPHQVALGHMHESNI